MAAAAAAYVRQGVGKVSGSTDRPWLAHYDPGVPRSLTYPAIALPQLLRDTAARHPMAVATLFGGVVARRLVDAPLSYAELHHLADPVPPGLQALGVRQGHRVAP